MFSPISISNQALTELGSERIASFDDDTVESNECRFQYDRTRISELRRNFWAFAIERTNLAALDESEDVFDDGISIYNLPTDCIRAQKGQRIYGPHIRWTLEGRRIFTSVGSPLRFRYVRDVENVSTMDPLFRDALALRMAWNMAETLTQSNTKKEAVEKKYMGIIREAKAISSIEQEPQKVAESTWITVRL